MHAVLSAAQLAGEPGQTITPVSVTACGPLASRDSRAASCGRTRNCATTGSSEGATRGGAGSTRSTARVVVLVPAFAATARKVAMPTAETPATE